MEDPRQDGEPDLGSDDRGVCIGKQIRLEMKAWWQSGQCFLVRWVEKTVLESICSY